VLGLVGIVTSSLALYRASLILVHQQFVIELVGINCDIFSRPPRTTPSDVNNTTITRQTLPTSLVGDTDVPQAGSRSVPAGAGSQSAGVGGSELNAEQIVSRFAEGAGLSLNDVVSNYSQYAQAIQQSFAQQRNTGQ